MSGRARSSSVAAQAWSRAASLRATDFSIAARSMRSRRKRRMRQVVMGTAFVLTALVTAQRVSAALESMSTELMDERWISTMLSDSLLIARTGLEARARDVVRVVPVEGRMDWRPTAGTLASGMSTHRRHPILLIVRPHNGVDLSAPEGEAVHAPANGMVRRVDYNLGYGQFVEIDHGNGIETLYAHLLSVSVKQGDSVRVGAFIGQVGHSGLTTGAHLHYEIKWKGRPIDPERFALRTTRLVPTVMPQ